MIAFYQNQADEARSAIKSQLQQMSIITARCAEAAANGQEDFLMWLSNANFLDNANTVAFWAMKYTAAMSALKAVKEGKIYKVHSL
jgi:hypothetical protein